MIFKTTAFGAALCGASLLAMPVVAQTADEKLKYVQSVNWECDDRVAFDGADGGLHDTVSVLKITFDADWRFTGIFSSSLPYGDGLFNRSYNITGYAFDDDGTGRSGIMIDGFTLTHRDGLPQGIGWRQMARMIYYIQLDDNAMSLQGIWEDTSGGRSTTVCG